MKSSFASPMTWRHTERLPLSKPSQKASPLVAHSEGPLGIVPPPPSGTPANSGSAPTLFGWQTRVASMQVVASGSAHSTPAQVASSSSSRS